MIARKRLRSYDWIAVDLNTQRDFCEPGGRYPVVNLLEFMPALRHMMAWIKWHGIPLVSSLDSHRTSEFSCDGHPVCCIDGSNGQRKLPFTMVRRLLRVEFDNTFSVPLDPFEDHQQLLFRQRTADLLSNPKAERLLTQIQGREFLLFGNSLEHAVKALALGLLAREKRVTIVADACGYWQRAEADLAIRQLIAKGALVTTVADVLARRPRQRVAYHLMPETDVSRNGHHSGPGNGHSLAAPWPTMAPRRNGTAGSKSNGSLPH